MISGKSDNIQVHSSGVCGVCRSERWLDLQKLMLMCFTSSINFQSCLLKKVVMWMSISPQCGSIGYHLTNFPLAPIEHHQRLSRMNYAGLSMLRQTQQKRVGYTHLPQSCFQCQNAKQHSPFRLQSPADIGVKIQTHGVMMINSNLNQFTSWLTLVMK